MANTPIEDLREAIITAAGSGPVTLNSAFIKNANQDLNPPDNYDDMLKAAWRLDSADGLKLTINANNVGAVQHGAFKVTAAQLTDGFLNATAPSTDVTLFFAQPAADFSNQVQAELLQWDFNDFFKWWNGWIFTQFAVSKNTFIFSTPKVSDFSWNGTTISLDPGQNYAGIIAPPESIQPYLVLFQGLAGIPSSLPIYGPIVLDKVDNDKILYPDMTVNALISSEEVKVFFLEAKKPRIGFQVKTVEQDNNSGSREGEFGEENSLLAQWEDDRPRRLLRASDPAPLEDKSYEQSVAFFLATTFVLTDSDGREIPLIFRVEITQFGSSYNFSLEADPDSDSRLTPAAVIGLMGGNSYLQLVPPQLQQFLTNVGFNGLTLSGPLGNSPSISALGVNLGSVPGTELVLFGDPSNGASFVINQFDLAWTVLSPLDRQKLQNQVLFTTTFTLFPEVFKGKFDVSIDQDFNIEAAYKGTLDLDDLLSAITAGFIGVPEGVSIVFTGATLSINPTQKTYAFGFTFNAEVNFIELNGEPLIKFQEVDISLKASTPTQNNAGQSLALIGDAPAKTVYEAAIQGTVSVGDIIAVNASVVYDGTADPKVWELKTSLAQPLELSALVNQFAPVFGLPAFLPGDLTVNTFAIEATIPTKATDPAKQKQSTYKLDGTVAWNFDLPGLPIKTTAEIGLAYDGNQPEGKRLSGSVIGNLEVALLDGQLNFEIQVGYRFGTAADDAKDLGMKLLQAPGVTANTPSEVLWVEWEGIRATYDKTKQLMIFQLKGWTVGKIIETLVRMIDVSNPFFTLPSPWDLLNKIPLDGLKITYNLKKGVKNPISASYSLPSPINLGFVTIKGLSFKNAEGKVTIAIDGSTSIPGLSDQPLFKPEGEGQNVQDMPDVPGQGNAFFDLRLLVMGQRIAINDPGSFDSVPAIIKALSGVPPTTGGKNPVNPGDTTPLQPFYSQESNWLAATNFGILRVGNQYTLDLQIVFNDPNVYGLRIALNGEKAKILAGLVLEILYKKVTDDIGLYQLDFSFPAAIRRLRFGAYTIILPSIRIQVYTNGDFFVDFGFPYNLDFSRSFTLEAIIMVGPVPVPILGSAGFYFGKLSNATAKNLPATTKGTFNPVIVFGVGLQFGFGKSIDAGILKAGFSATVFGIIEGTFAAWHPYPGSPSGSGNELQGNYYFKLKGTAGVIGKLYGTVDFAIIKADVNVLVQFYVEFIYESFRAIPITAAAHVSVKVSVKINLGLFSIKVSFSFATTVKLSAVLGSDAQAPWDDNKAKLESRFTRLGRNMERMMALRAKQRPNFKFKPVALAKSAEKKAITLVPAPQYTVLVKDQHATSLKDQVGAFVLMFAMDAPTEGSSGNESASSFENLAEDLLPWIIDAVSSQNNTADLAAAADESVSREQLQAILDALSDNSQQPITQAALLSFLETNFNFTVEKPSDNNKDRLQAGATIFPPFTGFSLEAPDPDNAAETITVQFDNYVTITEAYSQLIGQLFSELAARVEQESGDATRAKVISTDPEPLMQFIFVDYFVLVAKQLVQLANDALGDYAYPLSDGDSLASIAAFATDAGNDIDMVEDIAKPNSQTALSGGNKLELAGLTYVVQNGESIAAIASAHSDPDGSRWTTDPSTIIMLNQAQNNLILTGVTISLNDKTYVTQPGDSFQGIAAGLDLSIESLAKNPDFQKLKTILAPTIRTLIPTISYQTAADGADSFVTIINRFSMSLEQLAGLADNQKVPNIFDSSKAATIPIANLQRLKVSSLWDAITARKQVGQVAGMAARYQMHAMRLPVEEGLGLPDHFLFPTTGQSDYGLYQLTGQEIPTPAYTSGADYPLKIGKTGLDWITFKDAVDGKLELSLKEQFAQLDMVLSWAVEKGYDPAPTLNIEPLVNLTPKRNPVGGITRWSTSDMPQLEALTAPSGSLAAESGNTQRQPLLWAFPDSVLAEAEARQAILSKGLNIKDSLPYLQVLSPQIGVTDPATRTTRFSDVNNYAFSTRIDFQIKRLAQDADLAPDNPFATNTIPEGDGNQGSPARPLAPFTYQMIGPGPADAVLLERLLTAMDSLGEGLISGIFITYADNGADPTSLVSRGHREFLAFLTQTNLSTETNPPSFAMRLFKAGEQPLGIANSPSDFVKLMWELSTVRSGGYYLYYQTLEEDSGLPDGLFDDSGTATLTLVITYDRQTEPKNGGRLTNYTNALVTTDAIDLNTATPVLISEHQEAETIPLPENTTLGEVAHHFGAELATLAALNANEPKMAAGAEIPIVGVVHQVTPAEAKAGDVYQQLAALYSRGAVRPINEEAIANFNPGLTPDQEAAVRIPPFKYRVTTGEGMPGDTFTQLRDFYGLSLDALAFLSLRTPGLYPPETVLKTDSINLDAKATVGTGNTGVALTRLDLGDPADLNPFSDPPPSKAEKVEFAKRTMFSLYQLLTSGFAGNPYFDASRQGLSFGPRQPLNQEQAEALRKPEMRQALFAQTEGNADFKYANALGFKKTASDQTLYPQINAAPDNSTQPDLPQQADNPYIGVGTLVQTDLRWVDVFGNVTVTPFSAPADDYTGPLNKPPALIAYSDSLINMDRWPNVRIFYTYGGDPGSPVLQINFQLDVDAYEDVGDSLDQRQSRNLMGMAGFESNAANDKVAFTNIYYQLNQDYTDLGVPGLSGNAVIMLMKNSLLAEGGMRLPADQQDQVRDFITACLQYVTAKAAGSPAGSQPQTTLGIPISLNDITTENIVSLDISLIIERNPWLTTPELRAIKNGTMTTTVIKPLMDGPETQNQQDEDPETPPQEVKVFADAFEKVFVEAGKWQMRVGTGPADPAQGRQAAAFTLWAVRMGEEAGQGLYFQLENGASFYAPEPVARQLVNESAELNQYATGKPYPDGDKVKINFTGADQNVWANQVFAAVDNFLAPTFSSPAFILDQLFFSDPEKEGYLTQILETKKSLAGSVSSTIKPILDTSSSDTGDMAAAAEKLKQALLNRLSNAFLVTSVILFKTKHASTNEARQPGTTANPRFFGQPGGQLPTPSAKLDGSAAETVGIGQNYSLSSAKIPLDTADGSGDKQTVFLFSSKNLQATEENAYVPLRLTYELNQLEHDITSVPGIENYEQSSWINFVNGPFNFDLNPAVASVESGEQITEIPLVLRALPQPPTLEDQTFTPGTVDENGLAMIRTNDNPTNLTKWNFFYNYTFQRTAQDSFRSQVKFNLPPESTAFRAIEEDDLFNSLAQFVTVYPAISRDFETYLTQINGATKADDNDALNAKFAVEAFSIISANVATAYKAWAERNLLRAKALPEAITFDFNIQLEDDQGHARVNVLGQKPSQAPNLPDPMVLIKPKDYEPIASHPSGVLVSYTYEKRDEHGVGTGQLLGYQEALNESDRSIKFPELNIFAYQNALSAIQVIRNRFLVPGVATNDIFQFRTPLVAFPDALVPLLAYDAFDLGTVATGEQPLETFLANFFKGLLEDAIGREIEVKITNAFSYSLLPSNASLPRTLLPISLLAPTPVSVTAETPAFVADVASNVTQWLLKNQPTFNQSSQLNFALDIFAGGDQNKSQKQPLLSLRNLYLDANRLKLS